MILVIGPTSSGKSLLLKTLKSMESNEEIKKQRKMGMLKMYNKVHVEESVNGDLYVPNTQPTIGTNLVHVMFKKRTHTLHEVGGSMAPIWSSYFKGCDKLIYVIDGSALEMTSTALVNLLETLSNKLLKNIPILILLNKNDASNNSSMCAMRNLLHLDDIIESTPDLNIASVSCSAKTGFNIECVADWISAK